MEETIMLSRQLKDAQHKITVLEQKLSVYEDDDLEKDGYFALKFFLKQQIDIVRDFKLKEEITKNPKDDKFYDRVKSLGEGMKTMISDLRALKLELKITPDDERKLETKMQYRTTPESIANVLGNTAGQTN